VKSKGWILIAIILMFFQLHPQEEPIQEQVTVSWWVLPLFAVDNSGNAIHKLDQGTDIHSLRTMEKPKKYNQMKEIEKEMENYYG